ncbi:efflux RND transporter permease subunit [Urbifossiella limnaea]|uniref:Efflux pump membrane transporter BepE n=1 Tax=Urbifossiella limnaea TaxID=2528023 RepID=A0A517XTI5_9BACT|nr:efflux RND transporter permease subunit [Urbifossiella limnaea]QDU20840.1 Efflux pump membrane transporter BepE [Urbifossiella limnaea]
MTRFFIDRPIFATVLSTLIVLAGAVALSTLPVAQYPEITPPTVEVSAVYVGANARVVADTVAAPIEEQVNGVEDMLYMSSTCTNDGTYTLTVTFRPGVDLNIAQVLVQNRVNLAAPKLPAEVTRRGLLVKKKSPSQLMIINLYSTAPLTDPPADAPKRERDAAEARRQEALLYLSNYATIRLRDELARLPGVGDITYLGQRDYSMRLWLDPDRMASKGVSADDVVKAVQQQNAQVAAGQVGQPPAPTGQAFQYTINTLGRLAVPEQFADMILKSDADGRVVRMRDVSEAELGALNYDQTCTLDGRPSVALSVYQLPGTNALDTARGVKEKMEELRSKFPEGIDYAIVYDTTPFIDESIVEVFRTLRDAVILVAVVMLVFLQSWRAAVIPLAAVPVAIVGTFAAMAALGYTVNNLTLFGLVLAVGIVVDDAIVVVEAVQHHVERGLAPRDATILATQQVAGPVIAVGLVLSAVFVPCVFISGIVGEFYRQFAVTIAVSTLLSVFVSLTLSPALCALLLKPHTDASGREPLPRVAFPLAGAALAYLYLTDHLRPHLPPLAGWVVPLAAGVVGAVAGYALRVVLNRVLGVLFTGFNRGFDAATEGYVRVVGLMLRGAPLVLVGYGGLLYLTYHALATAPSGFIPDQDKGFLLVNVQLPDAASLGRTAAEMRKLEDLARGTPGVRHTVSVSGQSVLLGANAPNFGTLYVLLDDFPNRRSHELGAEAIAARLQADFNAKLPGARVNVFGAPAVDGLGTAGGFKLVIEEPGATDPAELEAVGKAVADAAGEGKELRDTFSGFRADTPWLYLEIDRVGAQMIGVPVSEIVSALQVYFGSLYVNDFNRFGRTWQVNVQARADYRRRVDDLKRIRVRNPRMPEGVEHMVPLGGVLKVRDDVTGPVMVYRYNLYPAAPVTATPAPGVSSGEAIAALERAAADKLPPNMRTEWTELAFLQLQTKDTAAKAFLLSVVLVFLVLAAQYESWALPLAVILVVPMCLLSAAAGVRLAGLEINIFTQVGFVVLVGLACKNAILIVEFAKQRHDDGATRRAAAVEACRLRLRPIVMTSVAFIIGVVPLVLAEGAGAEMRRALGTAVFAGMVGVTAFGIFLTPVFYVAVQWVTDRIR